MKSLTEKHRNAVFSFAKQLPGLLLGTAVCLALLGDRLQAEAESAGTGARDCWFCLKDELVNLEKQVKITGLNEQARGYVQSRIDDVKKRMEAAEKSESLHKEHLRIRQAQKVEFFGTEATGRKFVYVIDKSGSMYGKRMKAAKAELLKSLEKCNEQTLFYVIFYDLSSHGMQGGKLVPASAFQRKRLEKWLHRIRPRGKTKPIPSIIRAISFSPDAIFFLSDGLFDKTAASIIRAANQQGSKPATINTIAFMSDDGKEILEAIAEQNGGQHKYIPPPPKKKIRWFSWWRKSSK